MKFELVKRLRCPKSGSNLSWESQDEKQDNGELLEGFLVSADGAYRYPVTKGIPRFVGKSNYSDSFGLQWNLFSKTQLDSVSGLSVSANRFWKSTRWDPKNMKNKWVLDVGCGMGRFAEIALSSGAKVVALDYSSAVDACYENLKHEKNFHIIQGDIYQLPFASDSFSYVYSLGVLQHTPHVAKAFHALPPMLSKGGYLCVDFYEKSLTSFFLPKYWLRPITKRIDKVILLKVIKFAVPIMLPLSNALDRIPFVGKFLKKLIPVANFQGELPLNPKQMREWSILDTFDWFSPEFDNPQSKASAKVFAKEAQLKDAEVIKDGHLIVRGTKP